MSWWVDLGYPPFEDGQGGFPRTGQVIKYYREKKMDREGRAWTRIRLAKELKISEAAIVEIEHLDVRLGVDRRERLCQLLDIPPILLGIRTRVEILRRVEERRAKQAASVVSSSLAALWWVELGYPAFAPGKDGFFPRTGQVVKQYRGQAMDTEGKSWTQGDLATALGLETNQTIWNLENLDTELEFERRQFLSKLFDIPPILFGIITLEEIDKLIEQQRSTKPPPPIISTPISTSRKLVIDVQEYTTLLESYWTTYLRNPTQISITNINLCMDTLYRELPHTREKKPIQELLCRFHGLVANVLYDQQEYSDALLHLDKAWRFAQQLNKDELKVAVIYDYGYALRQAGRLDKAVQKYRHARRYERSLPRNLWGSLLLDAGRAEAQVAKTQEKRDTALVLIDRVGNIVRSSSNKIEEDPYFLHLNVDRYHQVRGEALIAVGRNREGIAELKQAEFGSGHLRRQAYQNILQAQAQFNLGEYSEAARLAASGLVVLQKIESKINIARVERIYKQFPQDLFKHDAHVARLEYLLSKRRKPSKR